MNVLMVRAKIKEEDVAGARAAIEKVIQALEQAQPAGVRYASCLLSDGVTFVALLELEDDGGHPLRGFPAYQEMVERLGHLGLSHSTPQPTSLHAKRKGHPVGLVHPGTAGI